MALHFNKISTFKFKVNLRIISLQFSQLDTCIHAYICKYMYTYTNTHAYMYSHIYYVQYYIYIYEVKRFIFYETLNVMMHALR